MPFDIGKPFSDTFVEQWVRKQQEEQDLALRNKSLNQQWAMEENRRRDQEDQDRIRNRQWGAEFDLRKWLSEQGAADTDAARALQEKELTQRTGMQDKEFASREKFQTRDLDLKERELEGRNSLAARGMAREDRARLDNEIKSMQAMYAQAVEAWKTAMNNHQIDEADAWKQKMEGLEKDITEARKGYATLGLDRDIEDGGLTQNLPYRTTRGAARSSLQNMPDRGGAAATREVKLGQARPQDLPEGLQNPPSERPMPHIQRFPNGAMGWIDEENKSLALIGPAGSIINDRYQSIFPELPKWSQYWHKGYENGEVPTWAEREAGFKKKEQDVRDLSILAQAQPGEGGEVDLRDPEATDYQSESLSDQPKDSGLSGYEPADIANIPQRGAAEESVLKIPQRSRFDGASSRGITDDTSMRNVYLDEFSRLMDEAMLEVNASTLTADDPMTKDTIFRHELWKKLRAKLGSPSAADAAIQRLLPYINESIGQRLNESTKPVILSPR